MLQKERNSVRSRDPSTFLVRSRSAYQLRRQVQLSRALGLQVATTQQFQRVVILLEAVQAVGLLRAEEVVLDGKLQRLVELQRRHGARGVRIRRKEIVKG